MGRLRLASSALWFIGATGLLGEFGSRAGMGLSVLGFHSPTAWIEGGLLIALGVAARTGSLLAMLAGTGIIVWQDVRTIRCDLDACGRVQWQTALIFSLVLAFLVEGVRGAWLARRSYRGPGQL
jgi:hypothetical protein